MGQTCSRSEARMVRPLVLLFALAPLASAQDKK
jgi:hypothetical protein